MRVWIKQHENEASRAKSRVYVCKLMAKKKRIMPQNCCVPGCTKKVYEEDGIKISYHKFPENRDLFMKWIVAIRRDEGKDFKVTEHTRVCSP